MSRLEIGKSKKKMEIPAPPAEHDSTDSQSQEPQCPHRSTEPSGQPFQNQGWRWWTLLLMVGILSLLFRFYYLTHAEVMQPFDDQAHARADGVEYYAYARNMVRHGVFTKAPEGKLPLVGDSFRDPGYPVFLAGWMKVFPEWNSWYPAVLLSQGVLGALSVLLALQLARRWMPGPWLAGAGFFMAVWPHSISINSFILSESLSEFLYLVALFLLAQALHRRSAAWATLGGAGFALAALTNAVLLPFAPLLGLYFAFRRSISTRMFTGLIAGAIILPGAWIIRNANLPPSPDSSNARALETLVLGSWPHFYADLDAAQKRRDPVAAAAIGRIADEITAIETNPGAGLGVMTQRMKTHPLEYAWWYLLTKPTLLWGWDIRIGQGDIYVYPTKNSPFKDNVAYLAVIALCRAVNFPLFLLMIAGVASAIRLERGAPSSLVAASLLVLFVTVVYSLLQSEPRYSIPYRPLEILLAFFATHRGFAWLMSKRKRRVLLLE